MKLPPLLIAAGALVVLAPVPASHAGASERAVGPNPSLARFEGRTIDLRVSWEEATACAAVGSTTTCFRTEAEMDEFLGDGEAEAPGGAASLQGDAASDSVGLLATCSPTTRLYTNPSYVTPTVVGFSTRNVVYNLSAYGIDNATSSYKIGACDTEFWDGANNTGAAYPGNTSAGVQQPSMVTGWNDRVSSIYIY